MNSFISEFAPTLIEEKVDSAMGLVGKKISSPLKKATSSVKQKFGSRDSGPSSEAVISNDQRAKRKKRGHFTREEVTEMFQGPSFPPATSTLKRCYGLPLKECLADTPRFDDQKCIFRNDRCHDSRWRPPVRPLMGRLAPKIKKFVSSIPKRCIGAMCGSKKKGGRRKSRKYRRGRKYKSRKIKRRQRTRKSRRRQRTRRHGRRQRTRRPRQRRR